MSRNLMLTLLTAASLTLSSPAASGESRRVWMPWDYPRSSDHSPVNRDQATAVSPQLVLFGCLMHVYKGYVSPVSGKHCPMYPSCSSYARDAVSTLGTARGILMAFDRLHRCGHDIRFYEPVYVDGVWLRYDPVLENQGME
jgi:putative component of membrane protein insertase Oxa1/YidC/SpoIIIJ protein YidD